MIRVGLTGNIGSGKSTVAHIFSIMGVPVFYADVEANNISSLKETQREIVKEFGEKIVDDSGEIDRKKLGDLVFSDPKKLHLINQIIHPKVADAWTKFCAENITSSYVICEAAILFESGFNSFTDTNITVCANEPLRIKRVSKRDGLSSIEIIKRIKNQWSETKKCELSDYIIDNNEKELLIPQILKINKDINTT